MLDHESWIMQITADPKKMHFALEGALQASLVRDRTLWLTNGQHSDAIHKGDRMYLWSSGIPAADGKLGRLVAVATVAEPSQPHPQHDWQAEFRKTDDYDPDAPRVKLFIEALVDPPVVRSDVFSAFPNASASTVFFRNGHIQTTATVEPELDNVLRLLIQDRLQRLHVDAHQEDGPNDDLRRWTLQERALREGQQQFRTALLLTRDPRCAVTGSAVEACLEAAHIRPYRGHHTNKASNGILLRADIHILFDRGLLRINPSTCTVSVDATLKDTEYAQYGGVTLHDAGRLDRASLQCRWGTADV